MYRVVENFGVRTSILHERYKRNVVLTEEKLVNRFSLLNSCQYCLQGTLKDRICEKNLHLLWELKDSIERETGNTTTSALECVVILSGVTCWKQEIFSLRYLYKMKLSWFARDKRTEIAQQMQASFVIILALMVLYFRDHNA